MFKLIKIKVSILIKDDLDILLGDNPNQANLIDHGYFLN